MSISPQALRLQATPVCEQVLCFEVYENNFIYIIRLSPGSTYDICIQRIWYLWNIKARYESD